MGSMDRNTVIGFVLLAVLLFLYLFMSTKSSQELAMQRKHQEDSIASVKRVQDSIRIASDTTAGVNGIDTVGRQPAISEELQVLENDVIKITFSNKGGQPKQVLLKNYKSANDGSPVIL